jgi:hypothetical protein
MGYKHSHIAAVPVAIADRFIAVTAMKRGDYGAPANGGAMPTVGARHVTITLTRNDAVDTTLGTVTVTGTDMAGQVISEVITPLDNTIATGALWFRTVTSVVGGQTWVAAGAADSIKVGCDASYVVAVGSGVLHAVIINTTAAGTITIADASGTIAVIPVSVAVGTFYEYDVNWSGFLSFTLAAASDITILHTGSLPTYTTT